MWHFEKQIVIGFFPEQELSTALKQPQENLGNLDKDNNLEVKSRCKDNRPTLLYLYFRFRVEW